MNEKTRVAFFPDSYLEVNGAAMTCRRLVDYAARNEQPMLVVHGAPETSEKTEGSVTHFAFKRSPLAILLDEDLAFDPLFLRKYNAVRRRVEEFKPDVIHITGLNDISIIGVLLAWRMNIPALGSWHTNIHEFAASRLRRILRWMPGIEKIAKFAEKKIKGGSMLYYKIPHVVLSPNQELVDELARRTGRQSKLMGRGVDPSYFSPEKRTVNDNTFRIGSVGRLRAEKSVRILVDVEKAFLDAGIEDYEFLVVGEGNEREYLEENLKRRTLTGFLSGEPLAEAYANMDIFVFPSETDAFGNVAQEANASGVAAIVSDKGGPKFIIKDGVTGYVAKEKDDYARFAVELYRDREKLATMRTAARESAVSNSWDAIFSGVFDSYREAIEIQRKKREKNAND